MFEALRNNDQVCFKCVTLRLPVLHKVDLVLSESSPFLTPVNTEVIPEGMIGFVVNVAKDRIA